MAIEAPRFSLGRPQKIETRNKLRVIAKSRPLPDAFIQSMGHWEHLHTPQASERRNQVMRTKWKQDANYSKQMTEILRANGKKNKGRKNGPWTEKRTKKMIESVKKIRASEADKRKRREAKIFRDAQDQDVERQIWNYAKRNKLFKKIVEHGNLTHKQMGLLRKHFGKQRLEVPFGLLDTFTKAVANLA